MFTEALPSPEKTDMDGLIHAEIEVRKKHLFYATKVLKIGVQRVDSLNMGLKAARLVERIKDDRVIAYGRFHEK